LVCCNDSGHKLAVSKSDRRFPKSPIDLELAGASGSVARLPLLLKSTTTLPKRAREKPPPCMKAAPEDVPSEDPSTQLTVSLDVAWCTCKSAVFHTKLYAVPSLKMFGGATV
jgi:hypothetical protein